MPCDDGTTVELEGEVAWREGNWKEAVRLSELALQGLDKRAAMLRWRAMTLRGDALRHLGRSNEGFADLAEVLQRWPTAFRAFSLSVPVSLTTDGSQLAKDTAARLSRSPRFDVQDKAAEVIADARATIDAIEPPAGGEDVHVMLAFRNCTYFEQPPYEAFEYAFPVYEILDP